MDSGIRSSSEIRSILKFWRYTSGVRIAFSGKISSSRGIPQKQEMAHVCYTAA